MTGGKKNSGSNKSELKKGTFGGGGHKGTTYSYDAGSGGGASAVYLGKANGLKNLLVVAAGGGGATYSVDGAGAGGIKKGQDGADSKDGTKTHSTGGTWDGPGTTTGKGGVSDSGRGGSGSGGFMQGGYSTGGGGGGGGFYGGGAGGNHAHVAPGSGGSSFWRCVRLVTAWCWSPTVVDRLLFL